MSRQSLRARRENWWFSQRFRREDSSSMFMKGFRCGFMSSGFNIFDTKNTAKFSKFLASSYWLCSIALKMPSESDLDTICRCGSSLSMILCISLSTSGLLSCFLQNSKIWGTNSLRASLGISSCSVNKLNTIFKGSIWLSILRKPFRAFMTNYSWFSWILYLFWSLGFPNNHKLIFLVTEVSLFERSHTTHFVSLCFPLSWSKSLRRGKYL